MTLKIEKTPRGFEYIGLEDGSATPRLRLAQSSAIGDYEDSWDRPGSSAVWLGDLSLDRENVRDLHEALGNWLAHGSFAPQPGDGADEVSLAWRGDREGELAFDVEVNGHMGRVFVSREIWTEWCRLAEHQPKEKAPAPSCSA